MVTRKVDKCPNCRQPRIMWVPDRIHPIEDANKNRRYSDLTTGKWIQGPCKCPVKKKKAKAA